MIFRRKSKIKHSLNDLDLESIFKDFVPDDDLTHEASYVEADREQFDYKKSILQSAINVSNRINEAMLSEERQKAKSRNKVLLYFSVLLGISILFVFAIIILSSFCGIKVDNILIVGIFTYIIVNIFAILTILIKYLSENKLLETFAGVTQKLLEFLVQDNQPERQIASPASEATVQQDIESTDS